MAGWQGEGVVAVGEVDNNTSTALTEAEVGAELSNKVNFHY